jgi:hypothetical protein
MSDPVGGGIVAAAQKVLDATPSLESQVREFGEEKLVMNPNGSYRIDLTDRNGEVDMKKVHLAKEMFQHRSRYEVQMAEARETPVDLSALSEKERWDRWIAEGRKRR